MKQKVGSPKLCASGVFTPYVRALLDFFMAVLDRFYLLNVFEKCIPRLAIFLNWSRFETDLYL